MLGPWLHLCAFKQSCAILPVLKPGHGAAGLHVNAVCLQVSGLLLKKYKDRFAVAPVTATYRYLRQWAADSLPPNPLVSHDTSPRHLRDPAFLIRALRYHPFCSEGVMPSLRCQEGFLPNLHSALSVVVIAWHGCWAYRAFAMTS